LQDGREHPEIIHRRDALLCSINDRLGALCRLEHQEAGEDFAPLSGAWLDEMIAFIAADASEREERKDTDGGE
jgi:hypothetical protein